MPSLLLFLLLAALPAAAQQSVDAPRAGERETAQAGGQGFYRYTDVGNLRCGAGQVPVGLVQLGQSPVRGLSLRCAPVTCQGGSCSVGNAASGPGQAGGGQARTCPAGQAIFGYGADVVNDAVADLRIDCAPVVGERAGQGGVRQYVVAPSPAPTPIPRPQGGFGLRTQAWVDPAQAYADTQGLASGRYGDILTRSAYYGAMNAILQGQPATADMRFFRAAQAVTDLFHVGGVATIPGAMIHSPGAIAILERVNVALLAANMGVLRRVLIAGGPVDPLAATDPAPARGEAARKRSVEANCGTMAATAVSRAIAAPGILRAVSLFCGVPAQGQVACPRTQGFGFDLKMVEMEQGTVERLLRSDPVVQNALSDPAAIDDINRSLNLRGDALRSLRGQLPPEFVNDVPANWARAAMRKPILDFRVKIERIAIGTAFVFMLHGCTQADHARYLQAEMARLLR